MSLFDWADTVYEKSADISECGRYRYRLLRRWGRGVPLPFVMLNPSTADAMQDDPTIRRCVGFARALGFDGIGVWNLYALRSTDPAGLWLVDDPVGPDNDRRLRNLLAWAAEVDVPIVAAWGANARPERVDQVLAMPGSSCLRSLGVTLAGAPKHPLARGLHRIPDDAVPVPWPATNLDTQETR